MMNLSLCNTAMQCNQGRDDNCCSFFDCFRRRGREGEGEGEGEGEQTHTTQGHVRFFNRNSFLLVFDYTGPPPTAIIHTDPSNVFEISIFGAQKEYIVTTGSNLHVFGMNMEMVIGKKIPDLPWPAPVHDFFDEVLTSTLQDGKYVNVCTVWDGATWYIHTHPIMNVSPPRGYVIGCVFVAEPSPITVTAMQMNRINITGQFDMPPPKTHPSSLEPANQTPP